MKKLIVHSIDYLLKQLEISYDPTLPNPNEWKEGHYTITPPSKSLSTAIDKNDEVVCASTINEYITYRKIRYVFNEKEVWMWEKI